MDKFLRILAVLGSVILMIGFVWYRSTSVSSGDDLTNAKVLPSSKIGTALEMYSTDWSGQYPEPKPESPTFSPSPKPPGGWTPDSASDFEGLELPRGALMQSSKSGRIMPLPSTAETPRLSPTPTPSARPTP